ncbi:MAG TPA: gas vesicle protein [Vicinamibacterales bacterium]
MKRVHRRPSTIPAAKPAKRVKTPMPPRVARPPLAPSVPHPRPEKREVARIIDEGNRSLVDVIDNLLNGGVVLNADLILALANVDLVYVRLSALLCAADRVLPGSRVR